MKINFGVYCLGYNLGGENYPFEFEIDDETLENMTNEEKENYIYEVCHEYIMQELEICIDDF